MIINNTSELFRNPIESYNNIFGRSSYIVSYDQIDLKSSREKKKTEPKKNKPKKCRRIEFLDDK